ncbi:hypothetical protein ACTNE3_08425, partial [Bacillota bacterium HCP3S3_F1_1]
LLNQSSFQTLPEKYKCGLYGDGNFLESSLDNGHFITGNQSTNNRVATCRELLNQSSFQTLPEKYKCGLYGDGNFLESSLDNGHFITGIIFVGEKHLNSKECSCRDAFVVEK